jgi:hypothetical protein
VRWWRVIFLLWSPLNMVPFTEECHVTDAAKEIHNNKADFVHFMWTTS